MSVSTMSYFSFCNASSASFPFRKHCTSVIPIFSHCIPGSLKALAALAVAATLSACSDWTRPESLDLGIHMDEISGEELAQIRAFKQTEHKLVFLGMDATAETPVGRYQHLNSMPDSADYIFIRNLVGGLHRDLVQEIGQVRKQKGTRILADIDYISIEEEWLAIQDAAIDAGEPAGTDEEYTSFVTEKVNAQLACLAKYGCDGLMVSYNGVNDAGSTVDETGRSAFIGAVMTWRAANAEVPMFLRGSIQLIATSIRLGEQNISAILDESEMIIMPIGSTTDESALNLAVNRLTTYYKDFPTDRFVFEATVPDPEDPVQVGMTLKSAAEYVLAPQDRFAKLGLSIENAQDDYFNIGNTYGNIRAAITALNTTAGDGEDTTNE